MASGLEGLTSRLGGSLAGSRAEFEDPEGLGGKTTWAEFMARAKQGSVKPHSVPSGRKVKFRRGSDEGGRTGQVGRELMRLRRTRSHWKIGSRKSHNPSEDDVANRWGRENWHKEQSLGTDRGAVAGVAQ